MISTIKITKEFFNSAGKYGISDCNYLTQGLWMCYSTMTNFPTGIASNANQAVIFSTGMGNWNMQLAVPTFGTFKMYQRSRRDGAWSEWVNVI